MEIDNASLSLFSPVFGVVPTHEEREEAFIYFLVLVFFLFV
jgi:hypothetical protein